MRSNLKKQANFQKSRKTKFKRTLKTFFFLKQIKPISIFKSLKTFDRYKNYFAQFKKSTNFFLEIPNNFAINFYQLNWKSYYKSQFIGKRYANNTKLLLSKIKKMQIIFRNWKNYQIQFFLQRKSYLFLQMRWEKKFYKLNNKIHIRRKSHVKKYYNFFFKQRNKRPLILSLILKNKTCLSFTRFYFVKKRYINQSLLRKYNLLLEGTIKFWSLSRVYKTKKRVQLKKGRKTKQPAILAFIMQRRHKKIGFSHWEKYTLKWLKFSLFRNTRIKFYYSPIHIKNRLLNKRMKYIKIYKRLSTSHPRAGKWATVGLVGNRLARNTSFLKFKILSKILLAFYSNISRRVFINIKKKSVRKYSKYFSNIALTFSSLERRLDIILFRTNLVLEINLARLLIHRGYFQQNFITRRNYQSRTIVNDFFNLIHCFRHVIYDNLEKDFNNRTYETFHKIFLMRFYKKPKHNTFLAYFATLTSSISQMVGKPFWAKNYGITWTFLNKYKNWVPTVSTKTLYELQLNSLLTIYDVTNKENNKKKNKLLNWGWLKKEENILSVQKFKSFSKFYNRKQTLKKNYGSKVFELIQKKYKRKSFKFKKKNFFFLKTILQDLILQTGEKFQENLLVNFKYRYALLFKEFVIKRNFQTETGDGTGRVIFLQFKWFFNFL
jgi:hypothetical protein